MVLVDSYGSRCCEPAATSFVGPAVVLQQLQCYAIAILVNPTSASIVKC